MSKRKTEETDFKTRSGTHGYMAPELLNYLTDVNLEGSKYTNAIDIWALGCIVFRLAKGTVPFPPGPSLGKFSENESAFPSQSSTLCKFGYKFVRDLLMAHPSQRLTAQHALNHPWLSSGKHTLFPLTRSIY